MAVGSEHLGQQVRCPHCQQVVVAPPSAAPEPNPTPNPIQPPPGLTETVLHMPAPPGDAEDIFSPEDVSDDLFGRSEPPRIEMPPEPLTPTLPGENAVPPPQLEATQNSTLPWVPPPESEATQNSTLPWVPPTESPPPFTPFGGGGTEVLPSVVPAPWMAGGATEILPSPPPEAPPPAEAVLAPADDFSAPLARARGRTEAKVPWFMLIVFMPLLLYAIVMTISTVWLYLQVQDVQQQLRRRFEIMPDEGDKPGVQKGKQISLWRYDNKLPTQPLPEHLCTTLDEPLQIGDLQVTPVRVERKRLRVVEGRFNPEFCAVDSLVLYLRMKNLSSEYAFAPLDNYFDRRYDGGARPPFTLLEVGDKYRFYGGPAEWYPLGDPNHRRVRVEGRNNVPDVLPPGEQKELFVCTNGYDEKAAAVLFGEKRPYRGSFLWRVRVRRGLVRFEGKEYSATAVIGVRFTDADIRRDAEAKAP